MANLNLKFLRGLQASLPTTGTDGYFYLTTDTHRLYTSVDGKVVPVNEGVVTVANIAALNDVAANAGDFFYATEENVLCVYNGQNFIQINAQKTLAELGGVAQSAYDEKVAALEKADSDNADAISGVDTRLQAAEEKLKSVATTEGLGELTDRVTTAEGEIDALQAASHTHTFADTDVEDAISKKHSHTFADADVVDAISKKHAHTFNETELNKIADGDVAKWNGVAADHLTSADKTTLENSIKEAKKAGTDANTNIETYKVANDARVLAVEEDIAEITGDNGILAQAKTYSDGKLATARTEISSEIDADVKVVADELAGYKTSNDTALAGVKATAEAAATKTYTDEELAKKVAKADYETDKATFATKTELQGVDAKFANYKTAADQKLIDDAQDVEIGKKVDKVEGKSLVDDAEITKLAGVSEGANKVEASTNGKIKIDGVDTTVYVHPDKHTVSEISDFETKIASYDYATKTEARGYADAKDEAIAAAQKAADDITAYVGTFTASEGVDTVVKYIDAKTANIASDDRVDGIDERLTQAEKDIDAIEADYLKAADKTELEGKITAEKQRAEGIEGGLRTDVDAIKGDYLKAADKTELEGKITAEETRATGVESGLDARIKAVEDDYLKASDKEALQTQINTIMNNPDAEGAINSINEFTQYVKDHGTIAEGFRTDIDKNKEDIAANTKAITAQATSDAATYETKTDASAKLVEAKGYADGIVATAKAALEAADADLAAAIETAKTEAANQDAVVLAEAQAYADQSQADAEAKAAELDAALKSELQGEIDADVKVVSDALAQYKTDNNAAVALKANAADVYTKDEVDAAVAAAVETAQTWGEF